MNHERVFPPILVVDDNESIRRTLNLLLKHAGCEVTLASGGAECLRLLREGFRGLILVDVMMPDLDGWSTVRAAAENGLLEGNVICMLTALARPGPGHEDLAPHIFDYMSKPFGGAQILNMARLAAEALAV